MSRLNNKRNEYGGQNYNAGHKSFFQQHWILKSFLMLLPCYYFPLISYLKMMPAMSGLFDANAASPTFGSFSTLGWVITILVVMIQFAIIAVTNKSGTTKLEKRIEILEYEDSNKERFLSSYSECEDALSRALTTEISYAAKQNKTPRYRADFYKMQLKALTKDLKSLVAHVFVYNTQSKPAITVAMAYRLTEEGGWDWLITPNNGPSLSQLTANPDSCLNRCMHAEAGFLYYNDKNDAAAANSYVYEDDEKDNSGMPHANGSILCQHIPVLTTMNRVRCGEAIISIVSKRGMFVDGISGKSRDDAINRIPKIWQEYYFEAFKQKIENILIFLYIHEQSQRHNGKELLPDSIL